MKEINFVLREKVGKFGAECSVCGEFFADDKGRKGNNGIPKAIDHAKEKHGSTGGTFGVPSSRLDTLWSASIRGKGAKNGEELLFRETNDFDRAAKTAQDLVAGSPACSMIGAEIVQIKRVAHLWN